MKKKMILCILAALFFLSTLGVTSCKKEATTDSNLETKVEEADKAERRRIEEENKRLREQLGKKAVPVRKKKVLIVAPQNETLFDEEAEASGKIYDGYVKGAQGDYDVVKSRSFANPERAKQEFHDKIDFSDKKNAIRFLNEVSEKNQTDKVVWSKYSVDKDSKTMNIKIYTYDKNRGELLEKQEKVFYDPKKDDIDEKAQLIIRKNL